MNRAPGNKHCMLAIAARTVLWLAGLLLSSQAMAQPQDTYVPSYYPGPPNPWSLQPPRPEQAPVQPQTRQPVLQDTVPPQDTGTPRYYPGPMYPAYPQPQQQAQPQYQFQIEGRQPGMQPARPPQDPRTPVWNNSWHYSEHYSRGPTGPGYSQAYPQAMPAQAQALASAPTLETRIENTSAYVYQNLVLAIDVISTAKINNSTLQVQDSDDVILRQLGDTTVSSRTRQGHNEIVNTIYYLLTPLRSGDIELKPLHVTGTMDSGAGYEISYDVVDKQPIHLTVAAPDPGVQPWLPLQNLELSASLSNDELIGEGEPLTLTVEQRAVGMSGSQLPSVENQLQSPGHRVYREKTEYTGVITAQGTLVGTRSDRFTLVPQDGNQVEIPAIRVDWWNVARQRKETAVLQSRLLSERQGRGDEAGGNTPTAITSGSLMMWLVLLLIAFVLGRFSPHYMPGFRRRTKVIWQRLYTASEPLRRRIAVWMVRLSPQRNMHLLRRRFASTLPTSARLWFCVRNADHEQDVDDWSQVLRFLVQRRLQLPAHLPMSKLAEHIIALHPGSNPDVIRKLLTQLEAALFAGQPIEDFDAWKKAFKQQVRPHLFSGWQKIPWRQRESRLPVLNPVIS